MDKLDKTRAHVAYIGNLLFQRHLLDLAGGNISARVDDLLCISPRFSGPLHHWDLRPEEVMVVRLDGSIVEGNGQLSRESKVHLRLHSEFGAYGTGVIHAHSRNIMVFASMAKPIPPVMEATRKFGTVPVVSYATAHSADLSENIAGGIRGNEQRINKHAAAVLAPYHGLFLMGKDLDAAADAVERIDTNCYCMLMGHLLGASENFSTEREQMEADIQAFEEHQNA